MTKQQNARTASEQERIMERFRSRGDADYGGTRVHAPEEVVEIAAELQWLSEEEIRRRCAAVDLTGCHGAEEGVLLDSPEEYVQYFRELRDFCTASAAERAATAVRLGWARCDRAPAAPDGGAGAPPSGETGLSGHP